jgi:predicted secreted protein
MAIIKALAASSWATFATVVAISALAIIAAVKGFALGVAGSIALYFVIWWTLLFAVLPFGIQSQAEAGEIVPGSEPGAPSTPALREKAIWTTLVATSVHLLVAGLLPLSGL